MKSCVFSLSRRAILFQRGEGTLNGEVDGLLPATINEGGRLLLLPSGMFGTTPVVLCGRIDFGRWSTGTGKTTMVNLILFIIIAVAAKL